MQDEEGGGIRSIRIILLVPTMSMSMILVLRRIKIRAKESIYTYTVHRDTTKW